MPRSASLNTKEGRKVDITWHGHSCFRLRGKDVTLVCDPCSPETGYRLNRMSADIVLISHDHAEHVFLEGVSGSPKVVQGPGEYEIGGAFISGVLTYHDREKGMERGKNTAYVIEFDGITVCHLGDIGHLPSADQIEELGDADVLFVPVGGNSTINAAQAAEVVSLLGPRLVVPMHYRTPVSTAALDPIEPFLKEMGLKEVETVSRLSVTRSTLPVEQRVVLLDYRT